MAIQVRRGKEADFDPSKMLPGEWAVSLDTRYVRMCFAPGIVLRMATYEAFEADSQKFIKQMENILSETNTVKQAVERMQNEIEGAVVEVENYVKSAKGYLEESNTYAMQSKRYAEDANDYADDAYEEAERAKMYADIAETVTSVKIATKDTAGIIKGGENHIAEDGTLTLTAISTDSALFNSRAGGITIERIAGAVEQKQYSGKQLIPYPYNDTTETVLGVDWTDLGDGRIKANGTNTSENTLCTFRFLKEGSLWLEAGDYIVSGNPDGSSGSTYFMQVVNDMGFTINSISTKDGEIVTISEDMYIGLFGVVVPGATVKNIIFEPMIRKASVTDATWEPYVGGTFSPNPEYPQGIKNAEIGEIKTHNKNFIPYPFPYYGEGAKTLYGVTLTANKGTVTISGAIEGSNGFAYRLIGTSNPIKVPAGTYTISGHPGNDTRYHIRVYSVVNGDTTPIATDTGSGATFTLKVETALQIVINILSGAVGTTFNNVVVKPQLELGNKATEWEPYKSSTALIAFTCRAIEVSADDDYTYEKDGKYYIADTIEKMDGGYQKVQRIAQSDGKDLSWILSETYKGSVNSSSLTGKINNKVPILCTHARWAKYDLSNYSYGMVIVSKGGWVNFYLKDGAFADVEEAKKWMEENGFYFQYALLTPIVTPLTDEKVISLLSLKSFDEITHVTTDSTVKPIIRAEYGTSHVGAITLDAWNTAKRNEIKNAKLAELTNSIATALI